MRDKLLAIDIGNTNTVAGVFDGNKIIGRFRYQTNLMETGDEVSLKITAMLREGGIDRKEIGSVIICSVVPAVTSAYAAISEKTFGATPVVVGCHNKNCIPILSDNPKEVGADRIANTVGGFMLYGGPLIVVDLGTAITFDAVSAKGEYLGGVIAPGIDASMTSLFNKAAQLPQIRLEKPASVIGKNTIASMQSGAVYGFSGMIDSVATKMRGEMEGNPKIIATGGQSEWLKSLSQTIEIVEPDLTLMGIAEIYRRNAE
ncbi:MAG: type III pantothenate kinase [Nitrospinae bacterium]|nr:type III pantothenate kinase [Nitrospinota bacterium]